MLSWRCSTPPGHRLLMTVVSSIYDPQTRQFAQRSCICWHYSDTDLLQIPPAEHTPPWPCSRPPPPAQSLQQLQPGSRQQHATSRGCPLPLPGACPSHTSPQQEQQQPAAPAAGPPCWCHVRLVLTQQLTWHAGSSRSATAASPTCLSSRRVSACGGRVAVRVPGAAWPPLLFRLQEAAMHCCCTIRPSGLFNALPHA